MRTRGGDSGRGEDIGPYRFATRIAVGGMAEVFRALRRQSAGADRAVVLKRMLPALLTEPEWRKMFNHEARLGMRIRHRNVVEVLDHDIDGNAPYLVLEYVFGVDLRRLASFLKRNSRKLGTPVATWVVCELLAGLHAVHSATNDRGAPLEIVHRDVSPSNIFLSVHGDVKLGDLGIALAAFRESPRAPELREISGGAGQAKGKLGYLAPEQIAGRPIDTRADVFAAATILAELLLGKPLFSASTELGVLLAIRDADLSALRTISSQLPTGLYDVLGAALSCDPLDRTPSADAFRNALLPYVSGEDETMFRRELGAFVVGALDAGDAEGEAFRASLANTREYRPDGPLGPMDESTRPTVIPPIDIAQLKDRARVLELESSGASFGPTYHLRDGNRVFGPWTYARVVQALRSADISSAARVRIDDGDELAISDIAELARHLPQSPAAKPRTKRAISDTGETWDLAGGGIAEALISCFRAKETGLLLCESADVRKEIYLDLGVPTFVASNRVDELLGERLVAAKVVDRAELDLALAVMPRFEGKLGDTIVGLGFAQPLIVFRHIALHAREKLLDLFMWSAGSATFHRHVEVPDRSFPLRIDVWDLVLAGIVRRIEADLEPRVRDGGKLLSFVPGITPNEMLSLPEEFQVFMDILRKPQRLQELENALGDRERSYAAILLLADLGIVQWSR
jgi:serine/threonine-protein kinase